MAEVDTGRYTVGVFKDVPSAERGIEALKRQGFPSESLSLLAKDTPDAGALLQKVFGRMPGKVDVRSVGTAVGMGSLLDALGTPDGELARDGAGKCLEAGGVPGARRPDLRNPDGAWRRARRGPERAQGGRRPLDTALLRRRECRDWRMDRPPLTRV